MAIREIPVDPEMQATFMAVLDVMPVMVKVPDPAHPGTDRKIDSGEQRRDPATELPLWEVTVPMKASPTAKVEMMAVKVPGKPDVTALIGSKVVFGGLRAAFHSFGASGGWMFSADTVADGARPSSRAQADNGKVPTPA